MPSSVVGSVIVRGLEEERDEALEVFDCTEWEMIREHKYQVLQMKDSLKEEL